MWDSDLGLKMQVEGQPSLPSTETTPTCLFISRQEGNGGRKYESLFHRHVSSSPISHAEEGPPPCRWIRAASTTSPPFPPRKRRCACGIGLHSQPSGALIRSAPEVRRRLKRKSGKNKRGQGLEKGKAHLVSRPRHRVALQRE